MGLKRALGFSAFLGNKRLVDELQGELDLAKQAVEFHIRDWKEQVKVIPELERQLAEAKEKVRKEDVSQNNI